MAQDAGHIETEKKESFLLFTRFKILCFEFDRYPPLLFLYRNLCDLTLDSEALLETGKIYSQSPWTFRTK